MYRYLPFAFAFALAACSTTEGTDHATLESQINPYVKNDQPVAEAVASLGTQGFACKDGTEMDPPQKDLIECTRKRGPAWAPQSCTHTVRFKATAKGKIANLEIAKPACASK